MKIINVFRMVMSGRPLSLRTKGTRTPYRFRTTNAGQRVNIRVNNFLSNILINNFLSNAQRWGLCSVTLGTWTTWRSKTNERNTLIYFNSNLFLSCK